ncbi:MAG TPA: fatty acid--CoA ligase family protein [Mycobacteriales bacterium]|nr:fatty acid--CoA ligase family protein [Mycobacteriales bacterium]
MTGGLEAMLARLLAEAPPDAPAIHAGERWWTWGEVVALARELDAVLPAAQPGGRVGVVLRNRAPHAAAVAAILARGRTVVTFSPLQPPERLRADVEAAKPQVLVGTSDDLDAAGLVGDADRLVVRIDDGRAVAEGTAPAGEPTPGVAVEMLTSGTTGPPKRVRLGWAQLDVALTPSGPVDDTTLLASGVVLVTTPLVHIGGFWGLLAALRAGRKVALLERFELDAWVRAVEEFRPITCGLVPAAMRAVLEAKVPKERLGSLRAVTTGTQACPVELAQAFTDAYDIPVLATYGATEFAGAVAGWTAPLHRRWWDTKRGSVGRAFPGSELRVVDPATGELRADGAQGVLEVRSQQMPDGGTDWVRTSDLARIDADGFLFIDGRVDDVIVRGGFKVQPTTVQTALERHPAVVEACVFGRPDARLGAVPVAGVEVRSEADAPSVAELLAFAREHLLPYEVPTSLVVTTALPRTPSHKVSRPELLALIDAA